MASDLEEVSEDRESSLGVVVWFEAVATVATAFLLWVI